MFDPKFDDVLFKSSQERHEFDVADLQKLKDIPASRGFLNFFLENIVRKDTNTENKREDILTNVVAPDVVEP